MTVKRIGLIGECMIELNARRLGRWFSATGGMP